MVATTHPTLDELPFLPAKVPKKLKGVSFDMKISDMLEQIIPGKKLSYLCKHHRLECTSCLHGTCRCSYPMYFCNYTPNIDKLSSFYIHQYLHSSDHSFLSLFPRHLNITRKRKKEKQKTPPSHLFTPSPWKPAGHSHPVGFESYQILSLSVIYACNPGTRTLSLEK